jgi:hypothetical protein
MFCYLSIPTVYIQFKVPESAKITGKIVFKNSLWVFNTANSPKFIDKDFKKFGKEPNMIKNCFGHVSIFCKYQTFSINIFLKFKKWVVENSVLRIQIRRIRMFLDLVDPDPLV